MELYNLSIEDKKFKGKSGSYKNYKKAKDKKRTLRNKPKKQHINLQKFTRTEIFIYNLKSLASL